jgi:hypothetical protein
VVVAEPDWQHLDKVVQVEVVVEHHMVVEQVLVHKEIQEVLVVGLDKVQVAEVGVTLLDKEDDLVVVEMVDMVVHILHMVGQLVIM